MKKNNAEPIPDPNCSDLVGSRPIAKSGHDKESDSRGQQARLLEGILVSLPRHNREALLRFYVEGHTAEQIQRDLGLTADQFSALKAETKHRFAALCRQRS